MIISFYYVYNPFIFHSYFSFIFLTSLAKIHGIKILKNFYFKAIFYENKYV